MMQKIFNLKNVTSPAKKMMIGGLLLSGVLTLTSTNYDSITSNQAIHNELTTENTNRLANTAWKIKYYDCASCNNRADDLLLQENGKGTLENMPIRWSVKADTISILTDPQFSCTFKQVLLADENLMFGTNICNGDDKSTNFIANKVQISNTSAVSSVVSPPMEKPAMSIFDKTYMFKRGFEKVYGERKIDALIVHSSFCVHSLDHFDLYCVLSQYKRHGVAAHYLIDREGNIHRLVEEKNIAFHAGFGKMPDGYNAINTRSLGIEIINDEQNGPNELQYEALARLVKDIKGRHRIKYIKGHNHIAPGRKSDPWKFNWKTFYESIKEESIP